MNTKIDEMIHEAAKAKEMDRLFVFRLIKDRFLKYEKSENFEGWSRGKVISILTKMANEREESIAMYKKVGRTADAEKEEKELQILKEFLPVEASEEDVKKYTESIIAKMKSEGVTISMKDMKSILSEVQVKYPSANGKTVADVVKSMI